MMGGARDWLGARSGIELLAIAAALAVFGYVGWDSALWDPRLQLVLHLVAVGSILGMGVAWLRGASLPRTAIDLPILALLAAYALATVSAMNVGMSLRAMASVAAFAMALPVALIAVRHRPSWVGYLTAVPVLALAVPTLAVLGWRRLEWLLVGAPGLPPLRMDGEGTPFGSVAVPPFVIWPAWALAGLIEEPAWRRPLRAGLLVVGIPLTFLSGSRSAWLAIAVTAAVAGVPWLWARRRRLLGAGSLLRGRGLLIAIGGVGAAALVAALVIPRLTAVTSLIYRVGLWRDTLQAWSTDPLLGIGPGFMPYARQAAAADLTFPVRQPHSHNLPLGVLGDAGILGLAAAIGLVIALAAVAHPWRMRSGAARAASFVLVGLAVGGLSEDLTFLPNFNLLAITLVSVVLTDAGAVRWVRLPLGALQRASLAVPATVIGLALLTAMVVADAGAITHRIGLDAAADRRWPEAAGWFERSASIDPWHPSVPKALAVVADAAGDDGRAREAAETAVARNSGDGASWLNLSFACAALEDRACQEAALERTVATASLGGPELANAALGYEDLDEAETADEAFRRAVLGQRLTTLALDWPRRVPIAGGVLQEEIGPDAELNRLLGQWAMGEQIQPEKIAGPGARAVAHAILDERSEADAWLERAIADAPEEPLTWELAVVLRDHWGVSTERERAIGEVVRGGPFPARQASTALPTITWDIASFRGWPMDGLVLEADRVRPELNFPWALEAVLP